MVLVTVWFISFAIHAVAHPAFAQEISYEDRIGSNRDFDMSLKQNLKKSKNRKNEQLLYCATHEKVVIGVVKKRPTKI